MLAFIAMLVMTNAYACFSPSDLYSFEVQLPSYAFDIQTLATFEGVEKINNAYCLDLGLNSTICARENEDSVWLRFIFPKEKVKPICKCFVTGELLEEPCAMANALHCNISRGNGYYSVKCTGDEEVCRNVAKACGNAKSFDCSYEQRLARCALNENETKRIVGKALKELYDAGLLYLRKSDIEEIVKLAKCGNAGFNSRIVFYRGRWLPYHETGKPLIKCGPVAAPDNFEIAVKNAISLKGYEADPIKLFIRRFIAAIRLLIGF